MSDPRTGRGIMDASPALQEQVHHRKHIATTDTITVTITMAIAKIVTITVTITISVAFLALSVPLCFTLATLRSLVPTPSDCS